MERKSLDGLPTTIVADTESLRQQLRELHAAVEDHKTLNARNRLKRRASAW